MGGHLITALATVHLSATVGIHGVALVRVDGNAEKTGVGLFFGDWRLKRMQWLIRRRILLTFIFVSFFGKLVFGVGGFRASLVFSFFEELLIPP